MTTSSPATQALQALLSSPATAALDQLLKSEATPSTSTKHRPMITSTGLKRSRSSHEDSFDMATLLQASQPVEDSIAFPTIEWSNEIDDEDDEPVFEPSAKRRCRGLVRSRNISSELSSLGSAPRLESYGSLC